MVRQHPAEKLSWFVKSRIRTVLLHMTLWWPLPVAFYYPAWLKSIPQESLDWLPFAYFGTIIGVQCVCLVAMNGIKRYSTRHSQRSIAVVGLLSSILLLASCKNHPVDCAIGFHHDDCLPNTAGYIAPPPSIDGDAECKSYGLKFGSPAYAQCRVGIMQVNQTQQQTQAIQMEGAAAREQNSWNSFSNSLKANTPTHCHSQRLGSYTDTTCN